MSYRALVGLGLLGSAFTKALRQGQNVRRRANGYAPEGGYIDRMTDAYLRAALWSSTDDDEEPLDKEYDISDIAPEAVRKARKDVERFFNQAGHLLAGMAPDFVGHNFWLTRNHHGTGFWDRDLGPKGDELTDLSHRFGEQWMYVGDDGKVYLG